MMKAFMSTTGQKALGSLRISIGASYMPAHDVLIPMSLDEALRILKQNEPTQCGHLSYTMHCLDCRDAYNERCGTQPMHHALAESLTAFCEMESL
jgi:hypothetical protein